MNPASEIGADGDSVVLRFDFLDDGSTILTARDATGSADDIVGRWTGGQAERAWNGLVIGLGTRSSKSTKRREIMRSIGFGVFLAFSALALVTAVNLWFRFFFDR